MRTLRDVFEAIDHTVIVYKDGKLFWAEKVDKETLEQTVSTPFFSQESLLSAIKTDTITFHKV